MRKKRRWLWILLFILVSLILGALATGWNVVLVKDYLHFLQMARSLSLTQELNTYPTSLIFKMILGTLGFIAALAMTVLLFIKLLNEMRLNQLQSEFLATVSHELKTPIAIMELSSGLIRSGGVSEKEMQQLWESHQNELTRLKEEVEALLEAARWQSKPFFHKRRVNLEAWIQDSLDHWKNLLGPKAELKREGDPLPVETFMDLRALNLIANNLLSNARKFSQDGPRVILRTMRVPSSRMFSKPKWRIQFQDEGLGFDPAESKKIFHRFYRSRAHIPYPIPGTGLGLYLANSASRALGLRLRGESLGLGRGAVFTLEGSEKTP